MKEDCHPIRLKLYKVPKDQGVQVQKGGYPHVVGAIFTLMCQVLTPSSGIIGVFKLKVQIALTKYVDILLFTPKLCFHQRIKKFLLQSWMTVLCIFISVSKPNAVI